MHALLYWDYALFEWIHSTLQNPFLDVVLPIVRNKYIWVPLYFIILAWIFTSNHLFKALIIFFSLVTLIALTDLISGQILKKTIQRERPCSEVSIHNSIQQKIPCRGSYSFPSAHAANHFAMATFLSMLVGGWKRWFLFSWAAIISFAQIYVGLHYPMDILAGAIFGVLVARLIYRYMTLPGLHSYNPNPDIGNHQV